MHVREAFCLLKKLFRTMGKFRGKAGINPKANSPLSLGTWPRRSPIFFHVLEHLQRKPGRPAQSSFDALGQCRVQQDAAPTDLSDRHWAAAEYFRATEITVGRQIGALPLGNLRPRQSP